MPPHAHDVRHTPELGPYRMDTRTTPQVENVASAYPRGRQPYPQSHNYHRPEYPSAHSHRDRVNELDDYYRARNSTTRARGRARASSYRHHPSPASQYPLSSTPTAPRNFPTQQQYPNATRQYRGPRNIGHRNNKDYRTPLSATRDRHVQLYPFRHQNHNQPIPTWPRGHPAGTSTNLSAPRAARATQNEDTGKSSHVEQSGILPSFEPETSSTKDVSIGVWNRVPTGLGGGWGREEWGGGEWEGGGREGDPPFTTTNRGDLPASVTTPQAVQPFSTTRTATQCEFPAGIGGGGGDTPMTNSTLGDFPASVTALQAVQLFPTPRTAAQYDVPARSGASPSATMINPTRKDLPASVTPPQTVQPFSATQHDIPTGLGGGDTPSTTTTNPTCGDLPTSVPVTVPRAAPQFPATLWLDAMAQCVKNERPTKRPLSSLKFKKKPPTLEDGVSPESMATNPKIDSKKEGGGDTEIKLSDSEPKYASAFADTWIPTPRPIDASGGAQQQQIKLSESASVFADARIPTPTPPPMDTCSETAMGSAAVIATVAAQPAEPEFVGPTPTEATSIVPLQLEPQPALKRKKTQTSVGGTAGDDEKKVKKARKKKNEGVEIKMEAGVIDVPAALRVQPAGGGEKPSRKKKRKADGEVLAASGPGGQDAVCRNEGVEAAAAAKVVGGGGGGGGGGLEAARGEDEGKEEKEKSASKDGDEQSSAVKKKKKAKLEHDGGDRMPDGSSTTATVAITGEWAKKRTKSSNAKSSSNNNNNVKWTTAVLAFPEVFLSATNPKPRSSRSKSNNKRPPHSASSNAGATTPPERILRPNIWAASKSELVFVLPELSHSRSYNGVTDSSSNFPMVLMDDSTADGVAVQVVEGLGEGGYGVVRLTLVRDFACPIEELVGAAAAAPPPQAEEEDGGLEYIDESELKPNVRDAPMTHSDSFARPVSAANPSIPRTLPPEIDILTSSAKLCLPIILISSKEVFNQAFSVAAPSGPHPPPHPPRTKIGLGDEHAYVFWGFFKFRASEGASLAVEEKRRVVGMWDVKGEGEGEGEQEAKWVGGRVEWVFELEWVPGWDGNENEGGGANATRPWWADVLGPQWAARGEADLVQRNLPWLNLNLIPTQLVDGQEEGSADEAMPRGWLCKKCGRLNQKAMMRHRWCGGVALGCRDDPVSGGYAVELDDMRDPRQTPLALPINMCDESRVDVRVADWDDGMRTLKYRPVEAGREEEGKGILKHVFTCNSQELQWEATPLFAQIQREVCLSKKIGDSGPYFRCDISDSYASKTDKYAFSCMTWNEAPKAVRVAQELMEYMGRSYGEDPGLVVDRLTILGWVASGTRKASEKLASRKGTMAMLCLGNDVILTITPKWEVGPERVMEAAPGPELAGWERGPVQLSAGRDGMTVRSVDAETVPGTHEQERLISAQAKCIAAGVPAGKKGHVQRGPASADRMSMTLVHGDMLLFSGCDFEYSIQRLGTSLRECRQPLFLDGEN